MQGNLPAPLSAPTCDLRGYEFMPIFGTRLFGSDFYLRASAEEFRAAMKLWWVAYAMQCPAGSLPSDDASLARLADYGRDIAGWLAVKEMALRGFAECSDGRLYHPLLCEEAAHAFIKRVKERDRKRLMRAAKAEKIAEAGRQSSEPARDDEDERHAPRERAPLPMASASAAPPPPSPAIRPAAVPRDIPRDSPRTSALTEQDRTGQDSKESKSRRWRAFSDLEGIRPEPETGKPVVGGFYLDEAWQEICGAMGIDPSRTRLSQRPVVEWLEAGYKPGQIAAVIRKKAQTDGATVRNLETLAYFKPMLRGVKPENLAFVMEKNHAH